MAHTPHTGQCSTRIINSEYLHCKTNVYHELLGKVWSRFAWQGSSMFLFQLTVLGLQSRPDSMILVPQSHHGVLGSWGAPGMLGSWDQGSWGPGRVLGSWGPGVLGTWAPELLGLWLLSSWAPGSLILSWVQLFTNMPVNRNIWQVLRGETLNYRSGAVSKEWLKTVFWSKRFWSFL